MQLASYSIAFDACFGREGAAEAVAAASSSGRRLEMSEGGEEGSRYMIDGAFFVCVWKRKLFSLNLD